MREKPCTMEFNLTINLKHHKQEANNYGNIPNVYHKVCYTREI